MSLPLTSPTNTSPFRAHAALANLLSWTRPQDRGSQRSFYLVLLSYPTLPPASFHRPLQHLLTQQLLPVLRPALGASGLSVWAAAINQTSVPAS